MSGATGYRAWVATEDGRLVSLWGWGEWPPGGWAEARCDRHAAPAPVADCTCGINVVRDLDEMLAYAQQQNAARWKHLPCVVGAVEFEAPAHPGAGAADPPSTVRARRARLVELVAFAPAAEPFRPTLRKALGDVVVPPATAMPQQAPPSDEHLILELSRRMISRVRDPRRLHGGDRVDPARVIAETNMANDLMRRTTEIQTRADVALMCQELRAFLAVIGG